MERITIIGLGPIGTSIGLGLKQARLKRTEVVGTDRSRKVMSAAAKRGAVDNTVPNLKSALRGAQLVVLDTPLSETEDFLEAIGPSLEDECIVTDTLATKQQVTSWADKYLPEGTSFVGGRPLPRRTVATTEEADGNFLKGAYYAIIPAVSADEQAVRTVVEMVEMLGAQPIFMDALEHDSYAAAVTHLPQVLSSALVSTTAASEAWTEISRLAGSEFRDITRLASNDPEDSANASLANPDALVDWLGRIIDVLSMYRDQINDKSGELTDNFENAWEERAKWEAGVLEERQGVGASPTHVSMAGMFVGRRMAEKVAKMEKAQQRPGWKYVRRG